jgi:hypothetical protein
MSLSVCLITRNESTRLAAAVDSVCAFADEIVVTDTGSTDGTPDLAARLGASVNVYPWSDDFAAARNACLAHATCDWVFWLDADERLHAESGPALRAAMEDPRVLAWNVIREDFFADDRPDWFSEMYQLRLVRRDLPSRFVGRIHEHLEPSPHELARQTGRQVRSSTIRIQHWGYTAPRVPEKMLRSARLCEMELAERPGQLYYLVEWARALLSVRDPRGEQVLGEAAAVMLAHRNDPAPPSPMAASLIEQLLAIPSQKWASHDDLVRLGAKWFPRSVPILWSAARIRAGQSRWSESEHMLRELLRLLESGTHDRYLSFDPRVREDAKLNLGVALARQAKIDESALVFESMLASPRRGGEAKANLDAIRALRRQHDGGTPTA